MDAIGAYQNISTRGMGMRAAAVEEIGGDAALVLAERAEPVAGMDAAFAEPRADRLIDDTLQAAAMDRELPVTVAADVEYFVNQTRHFDLEIVVALGRRSGGVAITAQQNSGFLGLTPNAKR